MVRSALLLLIPEIERTDKGVGVEPRVSTASRTDGAEDSDTLLHGETVFRASANVGSHGDLRHRQ